MRRIIPIAALLAILSVHVGAQVMTTDVLGVHDLSPGGSSSVKGSSSAACLYCHAPHSGVGANTPLWGHELSTQNYQLYSSSGMQNTAGQPLPGGPSALCLSCHDGTVAVGQSVPDGRRDTTGSLTTADTVADLRASHPISLTTPLKDAASLVSTLASSGTTADPDQKVKLINGTVECTTCHEPHNQGIDPLAMMFLVRDGQKGQICLSCHDANSRTVNGKNNPLTNWATSIHATSGNTVAGQAALGAYSTVAQFACASCHESHNGSGPARLLRAAVPAQVNMDSSTQACYTCHSGGSNLQTPIANVYAEFAKKTSHPFPDSSNTHDASETVVVGKDQPNRHATCADCHNAHSTVTVASFGQAPTIRSSQGQIVGVSGTDGTTVVAPAANQYENCFRCHSTSAGKQALTKYGDLPQRAVNAADPLDLVPQFLPTATSSHPVTHDSNSALPQPSLRAAQLNLDGTPSATRLLGTGTGLRIYCTDCHNSDDNREFGGSGPNGPHGSRYDHMLERDYVINTVGANGPGGLIGNTNPSPALDAGGYGYASGPYALCGKCHDLSSVVADNSFKGRGAPPVGETLPPGGHYTHISKQGLSCSVCHTAHGMGSKAGTMSGERLVNFDMNVVAPNGTLAVSYNQPTNTCTLLCHGIYHNPPDSTHPDMWVSTTPQYGPITRPKVTR